MTKIRTGLATTAERHGDESPPTCVSVAYHAGPPDIRFYHRHWHLGVSQPVPADDWMAMKARADFGEFDFKEEA